MLEFQTQTIEPDITVLKFTGRMHLGNRLSDAERAAGNLIAEGKRKLVLDMAGVDYIDSAALGMLLVTTGNMEKAGGKVVLAGAVTRVLDIIRITHTGDVLKLHDSVEAAAKALAG
ncbi:MAG: STAS domain-containing protein [Bryobacteraceae bacterium]|nr:STAS domain-containing protein [Bryobacteraceae bacterium]